MKKKKVQRLFWKIKPKQVYLRKKKKKKKILPFKTNSKRVEQARLQKQFCEHPKFSAWVRVGGQNLFIFVSGQIKIDFHFLRCEIKLKWGLQRIHVAEY